MTSFLLDGYRYPSLETLEQFKEIEREKYFMKVMQKFFDENPPKREISGFIYNEEICFGRKKDDCICVEWDGLLLVVYSVERGNKNLIALFKSITDAFTFLAAKYSDMQKLPLDWPALNAQFDKTLKPTA